MAHFTKRREILHTGSLSPRIGVPQHVKRRDIPPAPVVVKVEPPEPIVINNEWSLSVPKILHAYWGGSLMPYIRYMTIKSFIHFNPDWDVVLWTPKYSNNGKEWITKEHNYTLTCTDYLQRLYELPIVVNEVDFESWGLDNSMAEVHKSDYLRTHLLATVGGVWTDMDILYFKPITYLRVNKEKNRDIETFVCISSYGHSTGFMMSCENNGFFAEMVEHTAQEYSPDKYQCIGPELYNKYGRTLSNIDKYATVTNIDMEAVYAHDAHHIQELWNRVPERFTPHSIGVHWYAGHSKWGWFIDKTNGGLNNLPNNLIGNILRRLNENINLSRDKT